MTIKTAVLIPGQGGKTVTPGMGTELFQRSREAREVAEMASDTLGLDMLRICTEADADELRPTRTAQTAVITMALAYWVPRG